MLQHRLRCWTKDASGESSSHAGAWERWLICTTEKLQLPLTLPDVDLLGLNYFRPVRFSESIEAPDAATLSGDKQENEAVKYRELTVILDGKQRLGAVRHPIGKGHFTAGNEGGPVRDKPDHDQNAGN